MKVTQRLLLNWIYMLCFLGGFINVVSVVKYSYTISHFTGNVSKTAIKIASGHFLDVVTMVLIMVFFMLGSTVSGILVEGREFNLKKRYGYSMFLLGIGLLLVYFLAGNTIIFFYYLPFMLGVQNGLFISYDGVVIRTTHISGCVTDAGVYLGHYLKGKTEDKWKGIFCLFMIGAFFIGGLFGASLYFILYDKVFIVIGICYLGISAVYFYLRQRHLLVTTKS